MHGNVVWMVRCRQRDSVSKSVRETIAKRRQYRLGGHEKRQSEWAELGCLICVYVLNGYGDEEQCFLSHQHLQAKVTIRERKETHLDEQLTGNMATLSVLAVFGICKGLPTQHSICCLQPNFIYVIYVLMRYVYLSWLT